MKLSFERINTLLSKALKIEPLQLKSSFRPATEQDFEDIVEFRRNYFDEELPWDDRAYLLWRYDFGNGELENRNIFWILKIDGELLGVIGIEFLELVVKGVITKAHHPLDILVKPELDGLGIGAWLSLAINEKYDVILAIGANENSKSLFKKTFHPMPDRRTWKLLMKSEDFVRKSLKSSLLVNLVSSLLDRVLSFRRVISKRTSLPKGAEIKSIERFSHEVNEWKLSRTNMPSVYRLRSMEYLNWRFVDNPRRNHEIIGLYFQGILIAYIVYHHRHLAQQQSIQASIDDFFWDSKRVEEEGFKYQNVLRLLIMGVINEAKRDDAAVIRIAFYGKFMESVLHSVGFAERNEEEVFGVFARNKNIRDIIYDENIWFLTDAEAHSEGF